MAELEFPPVFIVGHPRSGTTWLTRLLGEHPHLATGGETHLFNLYLEPFLRQREPWLAEWIDPQALQVLLRDLVAGIFSQALAARGKRRIVEKTPTHRMYLGEIHALFPEAKFIHAIRDGRDVALSMRARRKHSQESWIPRHVEGLAQRWVESFDLVDAARKEMGDALFLDVQYEGLMADPVAQVQRILAFIDESLPAAEVTRMVDSNPPRVDPEAGWRGSMSRLDRFRFDRIARARLKQFGYEAS